MDRRILPAIVIVTATAAAIGVYFFGRDRPSTQIDDIHPKSQPSGVIRQVDSSAVNPNDCKDLSFDPLTDEGRKAGTFRHIARLSFTSPTEEICLAPDPGIHKLDPGGDLTLLAGSKFRLPVEEGFRVTRALLREIPQALLIAYDMDDGEDGYSTICRIDTAAPKISWCLRIKSFNVSASLSPSGRLYFSGLNLIGRADPETGAKLWERDDLFGTGPLARDFLPAKEMDGSVFFTTISPKEPGVTLAVDPETGASVDQTRRRQ